ncbi:AAA family ATPase [Azospirillum soli]|uniref:AAA family ATPase n=1 Tax=Azospirillum soli TaxID=1304799 RepID=UPI001AE7D83B|nr:AAA family ATPase [Azospirillum soli]MBP2315481.1 chromosome partitioning protein [Azospirillum soli]
MTDIQTNASKPTTADEGQRAYVLLVANSKGGVLKTTTACQVTSWFAKNGYKTLLIDADRQQSSADWVTLHHGRGLDTETLTCVQVTGEALKRQVRNLSKMFDVIVIDVDGNGDEDDTTLRAALKVCDRVVIPFFPCGLDARALNDFMKAVTAAQQTAHFPVSLFLARDFPADTSRPKVQTFVEAQWPEIKVDFLRSRILTRRSMVDVMSDGFSVWDFATRTGRYRDPKAVTDFEYLISELFPEIAASVGLTTETVVAETAAEV